MRILALAPQGYVLPSIHSSMVRALRMLGVETISLPLAKFVTEFDTPRDPIEGFKAIFTLDAGGDPRFIKNLKEYQGSLRIPWLIWFVDDPEGYGFPESCVAEYTIPFCWDREIVREHRRCGFRHGAAMEHLPLASDPAVFYPEENPGFLFAEGVFVGSPGHSNRFMKEIAETNPAIGDEVEKIWSLYGENLKMFPQDMAWERLSLRLNKARHLIRNDPMGGLWVKAVMYGLGLRKRQELVPQVMRPKGAVFGNGGWQKFLEGDIYRGEVSYGEELRRIYNRSGFVLDTRQPQSRTGLTQRIFDAGLCGIPVLAECSPELDDLFDPETECFTFSSVEEARALKAKILKEPQEARRRGSRLRKKVLSLHTFQHRAERMLLVLEDDRG